MSIIPISSSLVNAISSVAPTSSTTAASSLTADSDSGDSTRLSGFAQAMSQLQKLAQSNPGKAKQVLTDIANKLSAQAQAVGGTDGQQLSSLAAKFQQAASTGDLSSLQPAAHAATAAMHSGHHAHHKAQSAYGQTQAQGQSSAILSIVSGALASAGVSSSM